MSGILDTVFDQGVIDFADTAAGVSLEQNQSNLHYAAQYAMQQAGLNPLAQGDWAQGDMIAYLAGFKAFIISNPEFFTADTVAIAQNVNLDRPGYSDPITYADFAVKTQDELYSIFKPAVDLVETISHAPATVANLGNNILEAINNVAKGLSHSSVLTPLILVGLAVWGLSYASRPIRDVKSIF